MKNITRLTNAFDRLQRRSAFLGFVIAVIKKYGDDQAGHQAALLTYYGFLSLFPLLLVLTTVLGMISGNHSALQQSVIKDATNYFPGFGAQLSAHVSGLHKTGAALIIGLLITLYGTRGVADAFRNGVNHIWYTPRSKLAGFPKSIGNSLSIVIIGGLGFLVASVISSYTAAVVHGFGTDFRLLTVVVNIFLLFWLFTFLLNVSLPSHVTLRDIRAGAISAAVGLAVLQSVGSYLLARELKSLDALYSSFAFVLWLMFWIYLQVQVLYYAVEIASVRAHKLWPRSLTGQQPTTADEVIKRRQTAAEQI